MKLSANNLSMLFLVTPHAGVRIEMCTVYSLYLDEKSPPTRGCELKLNRGSDRKAQLVTPHAGVRIEINGSRVRTQGSQSPPTRGCELK